MSRILVALGGNAVKQAHEKGTYEEQFKNVRIACKHLLELVKRGHQLVITHGNGPQAGALLIQQETGISMGIPPQPLDIVNAMTQGQIGYMIQQTLTNYFIKEGINIPVVTVATQVLVDKNDPDFKDPSKPVGPFYTKEEAEKVKKPNWIIKKVKPGEGKVYRRVVPSPDPIRIVDAEAIKRMVDAGIIVIASGGGGIPVIQREDGTYEGIEAVIDKDKAGERLAEVINPDIFLILTDVEKAYLNYGKPNQRPIDKMTLEEAKKYLEEGHFLAGSMGPKVLACIRFLEWGLKRGEKKRAIITALDKAVDAVEGRTGTHIVC